MKIFRTILKLTIFFFAFWVIFIQIYFSFFLEKESHFFNPSVQKARIGEVILEGDFGDTFRDLYSSSKSCYHRVFETGKENHEILSFVSRTSKLHILGLHNDSRGIVYLIKDKKDLDFHGALLFRAVDEENFTVISAKTLVLLYPEDEEILSTENWEKRGVLSPKPS